MNLPTYNIAGLLLIDAFETPKGKAASPLSLFDGKVLATYAADALQASPLSPLIAVVNKNASAVRATLHDWPFSFVQNPTPDGGKSAALRGAIDALPPGVEGVVICYSNMPKVRTDHINALIDAFDGDPMTVCVPFINGKRGNPILVGKGHFGTLLSLDDNRGLHGFLRENPGLLRLVPMEDDGVLFKV